jgi:hypothetical protein
MGNFFTDEEMESMRDDFALLMESVAQFKSVNNVDDGGGGRLAGYTNRGSPVACHVMYSTQRPPKEEEATVLKQVKTYAFWSVWFPIGTTAAASDIFETGGKIFQVVTVFSPRTYELAFHVIAAVIDEGAAHA